MANNRYTGERPVALASRMIDVLWRQDKVMIPCLEWALAIRSVEI
ncbi:hypothetical protein [uncultured Chloroflexus sp.]|nr:hypothetical protein [uncultured Chloroflexus sp.]